MPQIVLKGVSRQLTEKISGELSREVAAIISVPQEHIVVEHNDVLFYRMGKPDPESAMAFVLWKKRPPELQEQVAGAIAHILKGAGCKTVEVVYTNLDMNDFYEFK